VKAGANQVGGEDRRPSQQRHDVEDGVAPGSQRERRHHHRQARSDGGNQVHPLRRRGVGERRHRVERKARAELAHQRLRQPQRSIAPQIGLARVSPGIGPGGDQRALDEADIDDRRR
jgi:hypothetical protein